MFGVISKIENEIVTEFFELFKTPWEYYRPGARYRVVLTTEDCADLPTADLLIISTSRATTWDRLQKLQTGACPTGSLVDIGWQQTPVYGPATYFTGAFRPLGTTTSGGHTVIFETAADKRGIVRIGYDILAELKHLLTVGQPCEYADLPAAETHIDILRQALIRWAVPFVEIPPVPHGSAFFVCLSHDVDFYRLRDHLFDHTFFGFVYRAAFGALFRMLRGRGAIKKMLQNWWALIKLPFMLLGLAPDPWPGFERYARWEQHHGATYFLIPFKDQPGRSLDGDRTPMRRAVRYDVGDIKKRIQDLEQAGFEIGLHGIDAWRDPVDGRRETARLKDFTTSPVKGVRMHWLYFNAQSHRSLDQAGFAYDTTVGYNETVGFKSGTAQVYRPREARYLLELPLILQDTALFYPDRMDLSEKDARSLVADLIRKLKYFGGCLTINWHHRSIAPERLWGDFYKQLLQDLEQNCACFHTARDVVAWFDARRQAVFKKVQFRSSGVHVEIGSSAQPSADMSLRVYHPALQMENKSPALFRELPFCGHFERSMPFEKLTGEPAVAG